MIEELTQRKGTKVFKISVEDTLTSTAGATRESSHLEDLLSSTPRIGNISKCLDILVILALSSTLLVKMITGDTVSVQAEEFTISATTGEHFTHVSTVRAPIVKSTLEVSTQEATIISTSETLAVISEMRKLMVQLAPILLGETNAPPPPSESTITTIVKTGSGSALMVSTTVTDIMEELTLQIGEQFFVTMKYCIELVLSGRSPFEFVRSLFENQIENIKQTEASDPAKVYQVLVEQLGTYSKDLRNLERVSPIVDAQQVSENLRTTQERERKEIEEQIAECTHNIDDSRVSYCWPKVTITQFYDFNDNKTYVIICTN